MGFATELEEQFWNWNLQTSGTGSEMSNLTSKKVLKKKETLNGFLEIRWFQKQNLSLDYLSKVHVGDYGETYAPTVI